MAESARNVAEHGERRTVVLLSGGVDSSVLLQQVHEEGRALPLFIDYGQRPAAPERHAAEAQCSALGLALVRLDASAVSAALELPQGTRPHSPLPQRNLVLVSLALSYAVSARASSVAVAVIRDDLGRYACTSASFWYTLRDLAATAGAVSLSTPLIYLDKAAVMEEGRRLGVDFSRTYSCVVGNETHCGRCYQCESRRNAAKRIGLAEPPGFYQRDAAPIVSPEQPVFAD